MIPELPSPSVTQYPATLRRFLLSTRWQQNLFLQPWWPVQGEAGDPSRCHMQVSSPGEGRGGSRFPPWSLFAQSLPNNPALTLEACRTLESLQASGAIHRDSRCSSSELPHSPPNRLPMFSIPSSSPRPTSNPRSILLALPPQVHFSPFPLHGQGKPPPPSPGP